MAHHGSPWLTMAQHALTALNRASDRAPAETQIELDSVDSRIKSFRICPCIHKLSFVYGIRIVGYGIPVQALMPYAP
jgi:hypothetical protein